ncbi:DHA2 family efflux MFS transporter permease subunit [Streptomyces sp. ME19-01-6]|uniref:DHA2 family efflux MFS transporter permease subunit n=1 Tax=Streptomyces sp. ME19-01-6 TaxID=3028686 RepID=UPI0029B26D22|nr:DHA2 family efflux MFS transporter permease subunit [Streptomyces sp. ME19-01-6]MDX3230844.1 DHA2 family efflux MFS transporter permease subunit [Streptomyces sp. ME19-01-6]
MSETARPPTKRQWFGLIAVSLGVALIVVDITIVNVILAPVIEDLKIDSAEAQWIQESYAIAFAALLLLAGRLSDLYGARKIFTIGLALFGATSLMAAVAPNGGLLILARVLQGVGGAVILPTSLALVNASFSGKARGQAFAVWGSTIGAAAAVGPLLGGWLADFSWRWAFGINLPLVALIMAGVMVHLPASPRTRGRVDGVGAVLSAVGLGLLAFALVEGRTYGWLMTTESLDIGGLSWSGGPSPVLVSIIVSATALFVFWRRQAALDRKNEEPLMDVELFSIASFRNGNFVTLMVGLGEFGIIAVLPLWLQFTLRYSSFEAGLALAALAVGSFVASGASFPMAAAVPALAQVRIGLALEAVGLVMLGLIATTSSAWWLIASALFVYGVGVGFATAQVTNIVLAEVPFPRAGQGSGIQSAARELGSALGIALLTTLFFSTLTSDLRDRLTGDGVPAKAAERISETMTESAGSAIPSLADNPKTAQVAEAAREAMTNGLEICSYVCAALLALALLATLGLAPKNTDDIGVRHEPSKEQQPSCDPC